MESKRRIHVIANIFIPTNPKHTTSAHTIKVIQICELFHSKGHYVFLYGDSEARDYVSASEHVSVIDINEYREASESSNNFTDPRYMMIGSVKYAQIHSLIESTFYKQLCIKLENNYEEGDIVFHIADNVSPSKFNKTMIHIDPSHMGGCSVSSNVVFITEAWYNEFIKCDSHVKLTPIENSTIILPWFDPKDFYISKNKERDIFLYLARCTGIKGFDHFMNLAKYFTNKTFWIAGGCIAYNSETGEFISESFIDKYRFAQKCYNLNDYPNVKYWGVADAKLRKKLLSETSVLIQPTEYLEPCGWNVIEALLSGTPVITPNKGGFLDTVSDEVGIKYENNETWSTWSTYLSKAQLIDPNTCRNYAVKKFSADRAYQEYINFFDTL